MTERGTRFIAWGVMLASAGLALVSFVRWAELGARASGQEPARTAAERTAAAMRSLEDDLARFLFVDGDAPAAVAARASSAEERFAWARPLTILGEEGDELNPPADGRSIGWPTRTRGQRFRNLLNRAKGRPALTRDIDIARGERGPTVRFRAGNPQSGMIVLITLRRDRLWATYRFRPEALERLLRSASADGFELALVEPNGRVHSREPWTDGRSATAAIETAPQWKVAVHAAGADREARLLLTGLASATMGLLLAAALLRRGRREASTPRDERPAPVDGSPAGDDEPLASERFVVGDATVDLERYIVLRDGQEHTLTSKEVALLRLLVASPNAVLRRDLLLDRVWGYSAEVTTRTLDTFMYRLRQKIEADPSAPRHLLTVRGTGYRFKP